MGKKHYEKCIHECEKFLHQNNCLLKFIFQAFGSLLYKGFNQNYLASPSKLLAFYKDSFLVLPLVKARRQWVTENCGQTL